MCLRSFGHLRHTGRMNKLTPQADSPLTRPRATREEILAWPPTVPLETGALAFGLPRSTAYDLAKRGEFPAKVIKAGRHPIVITSDVWAVLGLVPAGNE